MPIPIAAVRGKGGSAGAGGLAAIATLILDQFADSNGVAIAAHVITPTNTPAAAWALLSGAIDVQSNAVRATDTVAAKQNVAVAESGIADRFTLSCRFLPPGGATVWGFGVLGRVLDVDNYWLPGVVQNGIYLFDKIAGAYTARNSLVKTFSAGWHTVRAAFFGTRLLMDVDGVSIVDYTSATHQTRTKVGLWGSGATDTNLLRLDDFTLRQWPVAATRLLACEGDSLTYGYNTAVEEDYPSVLAGLLGGSAANWLLFNFGVNGQTVTQMSADAAAQIDTLVNAGHAKNICVLWGGTNDISASDSAATVYAKLVSYGQARQAAGWRVAVCTLTNYLGAGPVDFDTRRSAVNASIRAGYASFANVVVDLAADSRIGGTNAPLDATYFNADQVHMNAAGYAVVAGLVYTAVGLL